MAKSVRKNAGPFGVWALALLLVPAFSAGIGWLIFRAGNDPLERGLAAYDRKDWQTSWSLAREKLRTEPEDTVSWRLLARSAARMGRVESAQNIYNERLGPEQMQAEDYYLLGIGLLSQYRAPTAKVAFEAGAKLETTHPELLQELARLYAAEDELDRAARLASRLEQVPGWEVRADVLLGLLKAEESDPVSAADHLERALKRDPSVSGAPASPVAVRKLLARAQLKAGRPERAKVPLEDLLSQESDTEAAWLLSRALLQQRDIPGAAAALERAQGFTDLSSLTREPAPYVGAASCASCHEKNYQSQQTSRHGRTFVPTSELDKVALPGHPVPDPFANGVVHAIERKDHKIQVESRVKDASFRALIDYALGSGDRGLTLVGHDESGTSYEVRLSAYEKGTCWDVTTGHERTPTNPSSYLGLPISVDRVRHCLQCHTTDARAAIERVGATVADHGIGCERCHGPGGNHVLAVANKFSDPAIGRPQYLSATQQVHLCGECHSPRGGAAADPPKSIIVRFQATTLVKSRCFTESQGTFSCLTCHNPHRDAETSTAYYEAKCLSCHGPASAEATASKIESRTPCPVNPAKDCLKCHMPIVKDVAPHTPFTDHQIRVHRTPEGE
jgi:cytochrome c-type biogenesis protein CcmH/NrfG